MNVSLKNKVIWLSPECTGGKTLKKVFEKYDFFVFERNNTLNKRLISLSDFSWTSSIPIEYSDFTKVVTIRNPYARVYSCYEYYHNKNLVTRDQEKVKKRFNNFLDKTFLESGLNVVLDKTHSKDSYLSKWNLSNFLPDEFIRYENMENDVRNLSFIQKNEKKLDFSFLSEIIMESFDQIDYKSLYTFKNAQKVFNYYKNYFYYLGYDPFSFTKDILNDEDKIKFVHGL